MDLINLINNINYIDSWNIENFPVTGIAYHSKKVNQGNIFVCIKGYKFDGHNYIKDAIERGACAVVVEDYQKDISTPQFRVQNSRHALAALSTAFFDHPSKKMTMTGITATNGKTSTTFMIDSIFVKHGLKTGLIGTVLVKYGDYSLPAILTTPESLDLQSYLYDMEQGNVSHVTMEVSSSALGLNRVDEVDFDIVALNNISREHIDFHGSFEDYFKCKSKLITDASEGKWAVLNLDCPYSSSLINKTKADVFTYGIDNNSGYLTIRNLDLTTGRGKYTAVLQKHLEGENFLYPPCEFSISLSVPGYHSVYNSLVAIAVALLNGIPVETIQAGLNSFSGVERRFQFIFEEDFKIIDDHFANPGNINVTLETLNFMKYAKLHMVYAVRGSRGVTTNRENAETIVKWADTLGLNEITATCSIKHVSEKDKVINEELDIFLKVMKDAGIKVNLFNDLSDAIIHEINNVNTDDVLLLAGCQGMDYGAKIALDHIYSLRPDIDKDRLFNPLSGRIAGI